MILLIIFIVLLILGIIGAIVAERADYLSKLDKLLIPSICVIIVSGIGFLVMLLPCIMNNVPIAVEATRTEYKNTVAELNYTYTAYMAKDMRYENMSVLEYNKRVAEFKTDIINNQRILKNPWINTFASIAYKDFDPNAVKYIGTYTGE